MITVSYRQIMKNQLEHQPEAAAQIHVLGSYLATVRIKFSFKKNKNRPINLISLYFMGEVYIHEINASLKM